MSVKFITSATRAGPLPIQRATDLGRALWAMA